MLAWLTTFFTGLLEPIIQKAIQDALSAHAQAEVTRLRTEMNSAFLELMKAQSNEERSLAIKNLAKSINP